MRRTLLKSKIHRAKVTAADVAYEGSITVDEALLMAADILPWEKVQVWDVTNGARLETYAIPGKRGSGVVCINGAAAHHVAVGDLVIIASYADYEDPIDPNFEPKKIFVDAKNKNKILGI